MTDISDVRRNTATDDIHRAVESAIRAGMSVDEFRRAAADSWSDVLDDKRRFDAQSWQIGGISDHER